MVDFLSAVVGGVLTGAATLGGQMFLARREDRRWEKQRRVQEEEWRRDDRKLAFDYKRDSYVQLVGLHREWQLFVFDYLQSDRSLERSLARLKSLDAVEDEFCYLLDDYHRKAQVILARIELSCPANIAQLANRAIQTMFEYHYGYTPDGAGRRLKNTEEDTYRSLEDFVSASKLDLEDSQSLGYKH